MSDELKEGVKITGWLSQIPSTSAIGASIVITTGAAAKWFFGNKTVTEGLKAVKDDVMAVKDDVKGIHETLTKMEGERQLARADSRMNTAILKAVADKLQIPIPEIDMQR